jgi:hypothetical protein
LKGSDTVAPYLTQEIKRICALCAHTLGDCAPNLIIVWEKIVKKGENLRTTIALLSQGKREGDWDDSLCIRQPIFVVTKGYSPIGSTFQITQFASI